MSELIRSYYFSFEPTGVPEVDRILREVAIAGKSFHSTEYWSEKVEWDDGRSAIDRIQAAANAAAQSLCATADPQPKADESQLREAVRVCRDLFREMDSVIWDEDSAFGKLDYETAQELVEAALADEVKP